MDTMRLLYFLELIINLMTPFTAKSRAHSTLGNLARSWIFLYLFHHLMLLIKRTSVWIIKAIILPRSWFRYRKFSLRHQFCIYDPFTVVASKRRKFSLKKKTMILLNFKIPKKNNNHTNFLRALLAEVCKTNIIWCVLVLRLVVLINEK